MRCKKKSHNYLYGQRFTLITDHQPLVSTFNVRKGVSAMASARLQRWSLFLGAHQYDIEYKGTKLHGNADGLSRLPLELSVESKAMDPANMLHLNHESVTSDMLLFREKPVMTQHCVRSMKLLYTVGRLKGTRCIQHSRRGENSFLCVNELWCVDYELSFPPNCAVRC